MNNKLTVEKSLIISFNKEKIMTNSLPENIQNEIATLDKLRQDRVDAMYELEKCELAVQFKMVLLDKMLKDHFKIEEKAEKTEETQISHE